MLAKERYQTASKPIRLLNETLFLVMTGTIGPAYTLV